MTRIIDHASVADRRSVVDLKPNKKPVGVRRNTHDVFFDLAFEKNPVRVLHENILRAQTTLTRPISCDDYERAQKHPYYDKRHLNNVTVGATYFGRRVRRNLADRPFLALLQGVGAIALGALFLVQGGVLAIGPTLIRTEATPGFRSPLATYEDRILYDLTYLEWSLGLAYEHFRFEQLSGRDLKEGADAALVALAAVEAGLKRKDMEQRIRANRGIAKHLRAAKLWGDKLASAVQQDIDNPGTVQKYRESLVGFARYI